MSRMSEIAAGATTVGQVSTPEEVFEDLEYQTQDEYDLSEPLNLQTTGRLITQPYDYSIQQLVDEIQPGKIRLEINYQRKYVWDDGKASRLVESLLLNLPIPVCYFAGKEPGWEATVEKARCQRVRYATRRRTWVNHC